MLTVQYPENQVQNLSDLRAIPLRGAGEPAADAARRDQQHHAHQVADRGRSLPAAARHRHLRAAARTRIWAGSPTAIDGIIADTKVPDGPDGHAARHGAGHARIVHELRLGLILAVVLLYLILVAQFQSFIDPFIILLAVPPGLTGVLLTLWLTDTTLNVMSLMGVVMLVGIAVSNSILIVEFTRHLRERRHGGARGGRDGVPRAAAAGADDVAGDDHRAAADGAEARRRQRGLRAAGARDPRRADRLGGADGVSGPAAYYLVYRRTRAGVGSYRVALRRCVHAPASF